MSEAMGFRVVNSTGRVADCEYCGTRMEAWIPHYCQGPEKEKAAMSSLTITNSSGRVRHCEDCGWRMEPGSTHYCRGPEEEKPEAEVSNLAEIWETRAKKFEAEANQQGAEITLLRNEMIRLREQHSVLSEFIEQTCGDLPTWGGPPPEVRAAMEAMFPADIMPVERYAAALRSIAQRLESIANQTRVDVDALTEGKS